jgi:excisionase family DNA binding protein
MHVQGDSCRKSIMDSIFVTKKVAAEVLSISVRTLEHLIASKELGGVKRIGSRVVILRRALEEFARRNHRTAKTVSGEVTR